MMIMEKYTQPPEWAPHSAVWLAWPCAKDLWAETLPAAQEEFTQLCHAIADPDPQSGKCRGELLKVLVPDLDSKEIAQQALQGLNIEYYLIPFGDIWLRDTAPIFVQNTKKEKVTLQFQFNGWGEKYILDHDSCVAERVSEAAGCSTVKIPMVLEGGSIEVDGLGSCLTTTQCLLNPNRNPSLNRKQIEQQLCTYLGVNKILWLGDGLLNDHTDGHIDTIARFVGPGKIVCMRPTSSEDPNFRVLNRIYQDLKDFTDPQGNPFEIVQIPSPGRVLNSNDEVMPASYVNFYIGNTTVIVPTYDVQNDAEAIAKIAELFPNRRTVGVSARAILEGGGAFHCISQQEPR